MITRRKSRILALQILYSIHHNPKPAEEVFDDALFRKVLQSERAFALSLVNGCLQKQEHFHSIITALSKNWDLARISIVDRIILTIALFEMECLEDIPFNVTVNEAIEISKKFSAADAANFVNGLLDEHRRHR